MAWQDDAQKSEGKPRFLTCECATAPVLASRVDVLTFACPEGRLAPALLPQTQLLH